MGKVSAGVIASIMLFIILAVAFIPFITDSINNTNDQYECTDSVFSIQCTDITYCTNSTKRCENATYGVYNATYDVCQNTTGVMYNQSVRSGCDAGGTFRIAADYYGFSAVETVLMGLIVLIIVIAVVYFVVKGSGLLGKN